VRTLGTAGAETATVIYLGLHVLALRLAEAEIERRGLKAQIQILKEETDSMNLELRKIYDQIPEVTKNSFEEAQKLQTAYRALYDQRNEKVAQLQGFEKERDEILAQVPLNKDSSVQILETAHPGTILNYGELQWVLKETLRSVEVRWNQANANFYTKRI
jgi:chromosome segregation ATPase